jgi:uncharacterized protein (DUF2147 family)
MKTKLLFIATFLSASIAYANDLSPAGLWKTIDDNTNKPRSLVRITEQNGTLFGVVEKGLDPQDEGKTCEKCTDSRKDKPIRGMMIMQGLQKDGDVFDGGEILDPENGKTYKCKLKLLDNGSKLEVRGYIGISLLGRSQIWLREEN